MSGIITGFYPASYVQKQQESAVLPRVASRYTEICLDSNWLHEVVQELKSEEMQGKSSAHSS